MKKYLAICVSIACTSTAILAQEKNSNQPLELERIEVTAQKKVQSIQEVPISITAFYGKEMSDLGLNKTEDLGQFVPGLSIATASGEGSQPLLFLRGAGLNDFNTNNAGPVGIYSDEVYISSPALTSFLFFDTERLEVLKGPQGTLYGRNTTGGAVKFISNKPSEYFELYAKASAASFGTTNFEGAISGQLADSVNGRFAFIKKDSDGYGKNLLDGSDIYAVDSLAYRGFIEFDLNELNILVNVHGATIDSPTGSISPLGVTVDGTTPCSIDAIKAEQCVNVLGYRAPSDSYEGNYNMIRDTDFDSTGGYVQLTYDFNSFTLTSISSYDEVERVLYEESDGSPHSLLNTIYGVESETFQQEIRLNGQTEKLTWLVGAFYLTEDLTQDQSVFAFHELLPLTGGIADPFGLMTGGVPIVSARSFNTQESESYALFGQLTYDISEKLSVTLGGRYTDEEKTFDANWGFVGNMFFSPTMNPADAVVIDGLNLIDEKNLKTQSDAFSYRLAVDFQVNDQFMTYASVSRGFKSGGFNGGFLSFDPEQALTQLKPYEPEYLTAYEIGFKSDLLDNRLRFNGAFFYNDFSDLQVFTFIQTGEVPVLVLENASDANVKGIELDITALLAEGLTVSLSAAFMDSELVDYQTTGTGTDLSGNKLVNTPEASISTIVKYDYEIENAGIVTTMLSAAYKDDIFFSTANDPLASQEAHTLVNARVGYVSESGSWEVALFGNNLTDKEYKVNVGDLTDFGFYSRILGAPRSFGIELNYNY